MKKLCIAAGIIICLCWSNPCLADIQDTESGILPSDVPRIRIAAIFASTGEDSEQTGTSLRGVRLAVSFQNTEGGILGRLIELLVFDNASTPIGSKLAAISAVKEGVAGFVGPDLSSHALAVARVAQDSQIPMVANAAVNSAVTQTGEYIFRASFTDRNAGAVLARFVRSNLKASNAVVLTNIISDDSMGFSEHFSRKFQQLGGSVDQFKYKHRDTDFMPILRKTADIKPDIVFLPGGAESGHIIKQSLTFQYKPIFIGGDGWGDSFFFHQGGNTLSQGYYCTHWSKTPEQNELPVFLQNLPPQIMTAKLVLGFDAAMMLFTAIENAGSTAPNKVVTALTQLKNFPGISGNITMNPHGDPTKPIYIRKITNGKDEHFISINPGQINQ